MGGMAGSRRWVLKVFFLCFALGSCLEQAAWSANVEQRKSEEQAAMKIQGLAAAGLPLTAGALNVVLSNDDGWAVSNIRAFYNALQAGGYDTIVSAPATGQSGRASLDAPPETVEDGCQYKSCPPDSPPTGSNASDPRLNYVNSYPVTSMAYGIDELSPDFFDGEPDIALAGPNHGANRASTTIISGTVGAAVEAASRGIPAIAFSGAHGKAVPWNQPSPEYSQVYADLALIVTNALVAGVKPYLPENTWLNVNFPDVSEECSQVSDFKFVLARIYPPVPFVTPDDVDTCDNEGRLPYERMVGWTDGCYASISVGNMDKQDTRKEKQAAVLERLEGILSCLP